MNKSSTKPVNPQPQIFCSNTALVWHPCDLECMIIILWNKLTLTTVAS